VVKYFRRVTIFDNAITSLQLALEDFSNVSDKRLLSAVRNLHAGILLLYKTKLASLSPSDSHEVLLKREIKPERQNGGTITFVGHGRKTVNVQQIRSRFESLGIKTDWKRFEKVSQLRNEVEHYATAHARDAIRGMISNAFVIVRDFISEQLGKDPKQELGAEAWGMLLSVAEVFERERADCQRRLAKVDWESQELEGAISEVICEACGSALIVPRGVNREAGIQCRSCDEVEDFESAAERALSEHLDWQNHSAIKDGGEEVLILCPFCSRYGYIVEEQACAICGESCQNTCGRCGNSIPTSELSDGSLCGWCDHMANKDD